MAAQVLIFSSTYYNGQFCSLIGFHQPTTERLNFLIYGRRLSVKRQDLPRKFGHNGFNHNKGTVLGFFLIRTGARTPCFDNGSHRHVRLAADQKAMMVRAMEMQLIIIFLHSVFILNVYKHRVGRAWSIPNSIPDHM